MKGKAAREFVAASRQRQQHQSTANQQPQPRGDTQRREIAQHRVERLVRRFLDTIDYIIHFNNALQRKALLRDTRWLPKVLGYLAMVLASGEGYSQ